jgi:hypothetical protein
MDGRVLQARLMVRLAGVLMAAFCIRPVFWGVYAIVLDRGTQGVTPFHGSRLLVFYFGLVDLEALVSWLLQHGVAVGVFLSGLILVWRGSRWLERKVAHVLVNS